MASYTAWRVEVDYGTGWYDLTGYTDSVRAPVSIGLGDTAETSEEPGHLAVVLNNTGYVFTPGNATSTLALSTGMPIRVSETFGYSTFRWITGQIEFPEIDEFVVSSTRDQVITVTAVDLLTIWSRSATYNSTLGAHVVGEGGTDLDAYWPLNDPSGSVSAQSGVGPDLLVPSRTVVSASAGGAAPTLTFASQAGPAGDDSSYVTFAPVFDATPTLLARTDLSVSSLSLPVATSQYVAIVMWVRPPVPMVGTGPVVRLRNSGATQSLTLNGPSSAGSMSGQLIDGATTTVTLSTGKSLFKTGQWQLMSLRLSGTSLDLWLDDQDSATTSCAALSTTFTTVVVEGSAAVSVAHLQVLIGPASNPYTRTDHLAQFAHGLTGLERQTTGERIVKLGGWAGLNATQMSYVDNGCSVMAPARLSGKTIAEAMYEARDTEQGRLFINGDGLPVFQDRRTVFNI